MAGAGKAFWKNTRKPEGLGGKIMVSMMNIAHCAIAHWGFRFLNAAADANALDCGCGGGANVQRLLRKCPQGTVKGIDYSPVSVEKARRVNRTAIAEGRCEILPASVTALPFEGAQFDLVTAFETVYFWPDLPRSLREVCRVLKPGGAFLICNECGDPERGRKWSEMIDGMAVYSGVQLKAALEQAGFGGVQVHQNKGGWLCVTAEKPREERKI